MSVVKFTETVFAEKGKKGILTPDSDGYYEVVVGGLNAVNSAGEFYTAEGAIELFHQSSQLMRRIKNGALYSELGHPKRLPGMSMDDFYCRVISIEETNICGHFKEVSLDLDFGKKNPKVCGPDFIAMIAKVKPSGAKANALQLSLENSAENTSFSIRGLTDNKYTGGRTIRRLTNIVTWDFVTEGGIALARKAYSPSLESLKDTRMGVSELSDTVIDKDVLRRVLNDRDALVGFESNRELYADLLKSIETSHAKSRLSNW